MESRFAFKWKITGAVVLDSVSEFDTGQNTLESSALKEVVGVRYVPSRHIHISSLFQSSEFFDRKNLAENHRVRMNLEKVGVILGGSRAGMGTKKKNN